MSKNCITDLFPGFALSLTWGVFRAGRAAPLLFVLGCLQWGAQLAHAQEGAAATSLMATKAAPALEQPAVLSPYGSTWAAKGTGALKFFGFKAYDITLWLPAAQAGVFSFRQPFALDITYNTTVTATDINNTSLIEMARISAGTPEQVNAWSALMKNVFVDVKSGDRLVGVHLPTAGARFFLNGKLLGETSDVTFSEAFFRIWLDPKARKPDLRNALLGQ